MEPKPEPNKLATSFRNISTPIFASAKAALSTTKVRRTPPTPPPASPKPPPPKPRYNRGCDLEVGLLQEPELDYPGKFNRIPPTLPQREDVYEGEFEGFPLEREDWDRIDGNEMGSDVDDEELSEGGDNEDDDDDSGSDEEDDPPNSEDEGEESDSDEEEDGESESSDDGGESGSSDADEASGGSAEDGESDESDKKDDDDGNEPDDDGDDHDDHEGHGHNEPIDDSPEPESRFDDYDNEHWEDEADGAKAELNNRMAFYFANLNWKRSGMKLPVLLEECIPTLKGLPPAVRFLIYDFLTEEQRKSEKKVLLSPPFTVKLFWGPRTFILFKEVFAQIGPLGMTCKQLHEEATTYICTQFEFHITWNSFCERYWSGNLILLDWLPVHAHRIQQLTVEIDLTHFGGSAMNGAAILPSGKDSAKRFVDILLCELANKKEMLSLHFLVRRYAGMRPPGQEGMRGCDRDQRPYSKIGSSHFLGNLPRTFGTGATKLHYLRLTGFGEKYARDIIKATFTDEYGREPIPQLPTHSCWPRFEDIQSALDLPFMEMKADAEKKKSVQFAQLNQDDSSEGSDSAASEIIEPSLLEEDAAVTPTLETQFFDFNTVRANSTPLAAVHFDFDGPRQPRTSSKAEPIHQFAGEFHRAENDRFRAGSGGSGSSIEPFPDFHHLGLRKPSHPAVMRVRGKTEPKVPMPPRISNAESGSSVHPSPDFHIPSQRTPTHPAIRRISGDTEPRVAGPQTFSAGSGGNVEPSPDPHTPVSAFRKPSHPAIRTISGGPELGYTPPPHASSQVYGRSITVTTPQSSFTASHEDLTGSRGQNPYSAGKQSLPHRKSTPDLTMETEEAKPKRLSRKQKRLDKKKNKITSEERQEYINRLNLQKENVEMGYHALTTYAEPQYQALRKSWLPKENGRLKKKEIKEVFKLKEEFMHEPRMSEWHDNKTKKTSESMKKVPVSLALKLQEAKVTAEKEEVEYQEGVAARFRRKLEVAMQKMRAERDTPGCT